MSAWELTNITAHLVLPPGVFILLGLAGLAFVRSHARFGTGLALFSMLSLCMLAMPAVSRPLIRSLEVPYTDPARERAPGAIVVLGGGSYMQAPEYGGDTVSAPTLERLRYGAYLQRRTGKPLLVTGGDPTGGGSSEGEQMKNALRDFGATARWVESQSNNTFENARLSQQTLKKAGIQSVYLVTHAWHMPRAKLAFERAGLHVMPAPMAYKSASTLKLLDFIPSAGGLNDSYVFFHEVLGLVWYRLKFDLGR
ncbi:MAG TPA: YdcF family protein [Burkholderiales bacterium]|nr:YdcF family protein [Burkholderiales bacterium]